MLARSRPRWSLCLLLSVASLAPPGAALVEARAPSPVPVLFVPLQTSPAFAAHGKLLGELLAAKMMSTGRYAEAVGSETAEVVQRCIREVNTDLNAETCWVRVGQGQGAEAMVTGSILGDETSCTVTLRLTELETRLSKRMHVRALEPCSKSALQGEMEQAAATLAQSTAPATGGPSATSPAPPPPQLAAPAAPAPVAPAPRPPSAVSTAPAAGQPGGGRGPGRRLRTVGWVGLAGAGLVAAVAGGVYQHASNIDLSTPKDYQDNLQQQDDEQSLAGWLIVGSGALAVTSAVLLLWPPGGEGAGSGGGLRILPVPGGATLVLGF